MGCRSSIIPSEPRHGTDQPQRAQRSTVLRLARLDVPRERVGGAQGDGDRDAVQDERVEPRRVRQLAPVARLAHVAEVVHQDRDRGEEQEPRPAPRPHGGPEAEVPDARRDRAAHEAQPEQVRHAPVGRLMPPRALRSALAVLPAPRLYSGARRELNWPSGTPRRPEGTGSGSRARRTPRRAPRNRRARRSRAPTADTPCPR